MGDHHTGAATPDLLAAVGPLLAVLGIAAYLGLVAASRVPGWPRHRTVCWVLGSLAGAAAVTGPLAAAAQHSFPAHMAAHVLLGMLAPLLLVLAAPVTVLLRALPVPAARQISRVLASAPVAVLTEPVVAAVLSVGGLWLLYTTGLYAATHVRPELHLAMHAHVFLAGYLFAVAIVGIDPMPHRRSYLHRSVVLVADVAGHDILAKFLYAHPPAGVSGPVAETGAMVMYYAGDAVELALIVLLCARWYHAARPRQPARSAAVTI